MMCEPKLNRILLAIAGMAIPLATASAMDTDTPEHLGDDIIVVEGTGIANGEHVVEGHPLVEGHLLIEGHLLVEGHLIDGDHAAHAPQAIHTITVDRVGSGINEHSRETTSRVIGVRNGGIWVTNGNGRAAPEATTGSKTSSTTTLVQSSGDREIRLEIKDGNRKVWVDDQLVDDRFVIEKDGSYEILDDSGKVIAQLRMSTQAPPAPMSTRFFERAPGGGVAGNIFYDDDQRPMLGITMSDVPEVVRRQLRIADDAKAVMIDTIVDGFPAAASGIKPFDIVLGHDSDSLVEAIRARKLGESLTLRIMSAGDIREITVKLDKSRANRVGVPLNMGDDADFNVARLPGVARAPGSPEALPAPSSPQFPGLRRFLSEDGDGLSMGWSQLNASEDAERASKAMKEALSLAMAEIDKLRIDAATQEKLRATVAESLEKFSANMRSGRIQVFDPDRGTSFNFPRNNPYTSVAPGDLAAALAERAESIESRVRQQVEQTLTGSGERLQEMESRLQRIEERLERLTVLLERQSR